MWLLLPVSAALFFLGATFFYYRGTYSPPITSRGAVEQITLPPSAPSGFTDDPRTRRGTFLLDNAHANSISDEELDVLIARVARRGYDIEFLMRRDLRFTSNQLRLIESQLRRADSFAVLLPSLSYTPEELDVIQDFVDKGGRLLLVGDPGRRSDINSVADRFGFLFQAGYLYNVVDHDLNFRNIYVRDFRSDDVTNGLEAIALYNAGSIKTTGQPLAFTDTNTLSSMVERVEPFSPIAKSADGRILAISDLTFLRPPQNTTLDNDRLISNIADFLTTGERRFDLSDFPHFFNGDVEILMGDASLFDTGARVKRLLSAFRIKSEVRGVEDLTKDTIFLGLYEDSRSVSQYLDVAGVQLEGTLRTRFTPDIAIGGTGVLLLHEGRDRRVLVILGDAPATLRRLVDRLESGTFTGGLVGDSLGVYQLQ